ncbi:CDK-activating kinase assembly factor MAT1 [Gracilariopsis chorda]|uniref:CDK-activating kinase assembly factor MAT1 n=1 Tax=Gracilariopsis chorda TaxID=448386 RepID=A0A2V3IP14_9FLOR|nr:CDK-activating kinase assembly factor MAT1 [Gracilariopsis chorda]|eukprot:PXF43825.1 CDK-activating kinase assembly factor MAT1 [Gracilariopsis chorda]
MPDVYDVDFEDERALLTKDAQVRRRYLRIFNKRRDDFESDLQYDNYLEMVEELIFKLVNNVDLVQTRAFIDKYRRDNQDLIARNQAKKADDDRTEAERVAIAERQRLAKLAQLRQQDDILEEQRRMQRRQEEAEQLLRIQKGDEAVARLRKRREKANRKKRKKEAAAAAAAKEQEQRSRMALIPVRPTYPNPPPAPIGVGNVSLDQRPQQRTDDRSRELRNRAAAAAGFRQRLVYQRALLEFEQSLHFAALQHGAG